MTQDAPISLWAASAMEPEPPAARAWHDGEVDVAIVGGGFTGLATALFCAEAGLSAQVIEAEQVGYGGSGRNAGLVNAGIWLPPAEVRHALGKTYGPRFVERFGNGPQKVFDLVERHQIRCEATREGTIHAAHAPAGLRDLEGRYEEWKTVGAPVELLSRKAVAEKIGTRIFHGGLLDRRAGTVNPMGYCRGLARAAVAAGARIATGTRVTRLRKEPAGWRVMTETAEIRARTVVLGTNAYSDDLWPGLRQTLSLIHFVQLATEPLGDRIEGILPERQGVWTTGTIMYSLRRDAENRLVIGTMGRLRGTEQRGITRRWAQRQIERLFPSLGPVRFETAWHGQIAMTPDHLPRIHRLDDGLYTPIGYNGRGITTGTIFGQAMAGLLTGADPVDLPLPMTEVARAAHGSPLAQRMYELAFTANQIFKGF